MKNVGQLQPHTMFFKKKFHARHWSLINPSSSGGRDQEDRGSKPDWANSSRDPISKNPSQKRAGGGTGPEFKFPYHTHTKKRNFILISKSYWETKIK
jgi:hypothetical protein